MGSEALSKEIYEFPEVAGIFMKLELVPNVQCFVQLHTLHLYLIIPSRVPTLHHEDDEPCPPAWL